MLEYFKRFFAILFHSPLPSDSSVMSYQLSPAGIVSGDGVEYLWSEVNHVSILTTSDGPFCEDVFFVIKTDKGTICIDQSQATDIKLFEQFARLKGFSYEQTILAMGCTDDAVFPCWERDLAVTV